MARLIKQPSLRVRPRTDRATGLPSATRELRALERLFGPIPLASSLRREILTHRLVEIDAEMPDASYDVAERLSDERVRTEAAIAELSD